MTAENDKRSGARKALRDRLGRPPSGWQGDILDLDPELLPQLSRFYEVIETGALPERLRHLIWVGVDALVTHLYPVGLERHAQAALDCGASAAEVLEVLQLAFSVSERSYSLGMPILIEELRAAGSVPAALTRPLTDGQAAFKARYEAGAGYWPDWLEIALRICPDFIGSIVGLGHRDAGHGALDAKSRSLIQLAINACPATLDTAAVRTHIRQSLKHGADAEELIEVLHLASTIGVHALSVGSPILRKLVAAKTPVPGAG